jgi:hypothetical protein
MSDKISCALGLLSSYAKQLGAKVNETELFNNLKDVHAKAAYAKADIRYTESLGQNAKPPTGYTAKGLEFMKNLGFPELGLYAHIANPDAILGNGITDKIEALYHQHLENVKTHGWDYDKARYEFQQTVKPQIQKMYGDAYLSLMKTAPEKLDYMDKYFTAHQNGGALYGTWQPSGPIGKMARNLIKNFIDWNPALVMYHSLEFVPKALAYSIEHGNPINGPAALFGAMGDFWKATGGNFTKHIPELEAKGVYGTHDSGPGFNGIHRLVDVSENPIRGLSYFLGQRLGTGGSHAVEKVAFVHRFGNEPLSAIDGTGFNELGLMRYSIAQGKMYLHLLQNVKNPNALAALTAFSLMNTIQTGAKSAIPLPVQQLMPPEWKNSLDELDKVLPTNLIQKMFNTDLSGKASPLAMPQVGVPLAMVADTLKSTGSNFKQASEAMRAGDPKAAATRIVQALFGIGQLKTIPGVNVATKHAIDAIAEQIVGETDNAPIEFLKKSHIYVEPGG